MNAFAGFISLNSDPVPEDFPQKAADSLVRWKPDQKALFGTPEARFVQLIRYNTPESFYEKPIANYVHDIRLDNRPELAGRLGILNDPELPDSKMVLAAYEKWGVQCLNYLRGDFAFAIWDVAHKKLFCARDPMGQRLIYYFHKLGKYFAFASVVSGLPAEAFEGANLQKAKDFLSLRCPHPEHTFYKNIMRLKAGEYLLLEDQKLSCHTYWRLGRVKAVRFKKDEDYLEAFREIFGRAVQERLRTAYPVGAHLSGGLDSSSVVAMAAREGKEITTYSAFPPIGYEGLKSRNWTLDDTHFVELILKQYPSLQQVYVRSEGLDYYSGLDDTYPFLDSPTLNPCNRIWIEEIQKQASQKDIRALLIGAMGNATISWSGYTIKQYVRKMIRFWDPWNVYNPRRWMICDGVIVDALSYFHSIRAYFGVEFRDPTHDQSLVEFCLGLPNRQYQQDGVSRALVRRGMTAYLPDAVRNRRDRGVQLGDWVPKFEQAYAQIASDWTRLRERSELISLTDREGMEHFLANWNPNKIESGSLQRDCRFVWLRSFFVLRFIEWVQHGRRAKESMG